MARLIKDIGSFKKQQRAKIKARQLARRAKGLTARIKKKGGKGRVEVIAGQLVQIGVTEVKPKKKKKEISKISVPLRATPIRKLERKKAEPIFIPRRTFTPTRLLTIARLEKPKPKKKVPTRLEPVTRKKGIVERLGLTKEQQLARIEQIKIKPKPTFKEEIEKQVRGTIILGGLGAARGAKGVFDAVRNPIKFAKEQGTFIKQFAKNPRKVSTELAKQFERDPAGVAAEFLIFSKTAGLGGKAVKKSPVGRFVAEERFILSQPKEVRPAVRAVLKTSKVQEKIGFVGRKPKKVNFLDVQELGAVEARALKKTLQETDSIVFGSKAGRVLTGGKTKIPKDVDLATKDVGLFNKKFIENLPKKQRANFKIAKEKIVRVSDGVKILDVKPKSRLIPEKSIITGKGELPVIGFKERITFFKDSQLIIPKKKRILEASLDVPTQKIQKVEGIKFVGLGEQTTRKGLGTLQVILEKNPRRAKDPAAFIESLEIQLQNLKKSKPKTPIGELQKKSKIKDLESGLKVLKNKDFAALLNKKVTGLTKEFPLIPKIEAKKLKSAQKLRDRQTIDVVKDIKEFKFVELKGKKKVLEKKPIIEKPSRLPSKLPSKLIKPLPSRLPSKLPSKLKKPSKVPSKIRKPSKIPSKIPKKPSILPIPSKLPKPSKVPSKLPSKLLVSKLPTRATSKLISKLPSKLPITQLKIFKVSKITKKKITKPKPFKPKFTFTKFTTTIVRPEKGRGKGLKIGDVELFTGAELR